MYILDLQVKEAFKTWLSRDNLNVFLPKKNLVRISRIFKWYGEDFQGNNNLKSILIQYAMKIYKSFLEKEKYQVKFLKYNWAIGR